MAFTAPQPEHVLLDANHRSATITVPPRQAVLYSTCRRNSANEASATWRASRRLREHPGDVQVFDHQRPEPAGQAGGGLMQRVAALVGDRP